MGTGKLVVVPVGPEGLEGEGDGPAVCGLPTSGESC
jgi:hypothetical protein